MTQSNYFMSTHFLLTSCFTFIPTSDGNEGRLALELLFNRGGDGDLKRWKISAIFKILMQKSQNEKWDYLGNIWNDVHSRMTCHWKVMLNACIGQRQTTFNELKSKHWLWNYKVVKKIKWERGHYGLPSQNAIGNVY